MVPRPETAIPPTLLPVFERRGYLAQVKKNGAYSVVSVASDGAVSTQNRYGEAHKAWHMSDDTRQYFAAFARREPTFCAELLHSKVPGLRDTHYLHDLIAVDGKSLAGSTYAERYATLHAIVGNGTGGTNGYTIVGPRIWLARNVHRDFAGLYKSLDKPEDEGLVLKNPNVRWVPGRSDWCVKSRKQHKNFSF